MLHTLKLFENQPTNQPELVPLSKRQSNNGLAPQWPQIFFLPDDAALVTVVPLHVEVTVVSDGKNMWRQFTNLLVGVLSNLVRCVNGQQLIGVHSHQDGTSVGLHERKNRAEMFQAVELLLLAESHKLS